MMKEYSFNLDFEELDEELQEEKINEFITYSYENGDLEKEDIEGRLIPLDTYLEDFEEREKTRRYITAYFPLYF